MQKRIRTSAFVLTLLPMMAIGVPKASSTTPSGKIKTGLEHSAGETGNMRSTEMARSYRALSVSTPHNQLTVAREIAGKGPVSQSIFVRFLKNRPVYISQVLQFLDMSNENIVNAVQRLIIRPRPEWGHDLHKFLSKQETPVLTSLLELEANGRISGYHNTIIFTSVSQQSTDALNAALGSEKLRHTALRIVAETKKKALVPRVAHLLHDKDTNDHDKIACLKSLETFNMPASTRAVDDALEDPSHAVVNQALLSISKVGKTRQHEVLRAMLNNPRIDKSNVIRAMGVSIVPASVQELTHAFVTGTTEQKYAVLEAASKSSHKGALRLLVNASMDQHSGIGAHATALLKRQLR